MRKVLLFVFFIVVYGYADKPRFDNEDEDKPKYDNDDYEYTEDGNRIFEKVSEVFKKTRFGVRAGAGLGWLTFESPSWSPFFGKTETSVELSMEFGGVAIVPLSETGTFLLDIELNVYKREEYKCMSDVGLNIPLLFQFMPNNRIVLEAGTYLEIPLSQDYTGDYEYLDKELYRGDIDLGLAFGVGYVIEKFIVGGRIIYYLGVDSSHSLQSMNVLNANVSYLF